MTSESPASSTRPRASSSSSGWNSGDLVTGTALVVMLIALFLPWFTATVKLGSVAPLTGSGDGPDSHGFLWAVFALALVGLALLVGRDQIRRLRANLPSTEQMLIVSTAIAFVLCLLGALVRPAAFTSSVPPGRSLLGFAVSVGWSYGGFVTLIAAAIALVSSVAAADSLQAGERSSRIVRGWRLPRSAR